MRSINGWIAATTVRRNRVILGEEGRGKGKRPIQVFNTKVDSAVSDSGTIVVNVASAFLSVLSTIYRKH